jgi:FlaA1/EpsC-like NDP-sugar epimerase
MKHLRLAALWQLVCVLTLPFFFQLAILRDIERHKDTYSPISFEAQRIGPAARVAREDTLLEPANSTVLITGVAGFIGYSLASHLARNNVEKIVGVDNFNNYYDVSLKYKRADMLSHHKCTETIRGDVCNSSLLQELFFKFL